MKTVVLGSSAYSYHRKHITFVYKTRFHNATLYDVCKPPVCNTILHGKLTISTHAAPVMHATLSIRESHESFNFIVLIVSSTLSVNLNIAPSPLEAISLDRQRIMQRLDI